MEAENESSTLSYCALFKFTKLMQVTQSQLEDIICYHKYLYYIAGEPMISDFQYDILEKELKERFPNSLVLTYVELPDNLIAKYGKRFFRYKNYEKQD